MKSPKRSNEDVSRDVDTGYECKRHAFSTVSWLCLGVALACVGAACVGEQHLRRASLDAAMERAERARMDGWRLLQRLEGQGAAAYVFDSMGYSESKAIVNTMSWRTAADGERRFTFVCLRFVQREGGIVFTGCTKGTASAKEEDVLTELGADTSVTGRVSNVAMARRIAAWVEDPVPFEKAGRETPVVEWLRLRLKAETNCLSEVESSTFSIPSKRFALLRIYRHDRTIAPLMEYFDLTVEIVPPDRGAEPVVHVTKCFRGTVRYGAQERVLCEKEVALPE